MSLRDRARTRGTINTIRLAHSAWELMSIILWCGEVLNCVTPKLWVSHHFQRREWFKVRPRGHILLMCVKAHPELAGVGIENSWGKSAQHFRANNDCVSRHLHRNVLDSLHSSNLTLLRVCKFARRTRDYLLLYAQIAGGEVQASSHAAIEKLRKLRKTHRSAMDVDAAFISNAWWDAVEMWAFPISYFSQHQSRNQ